MHHLTTRTTVIEVGIMIYTPLTKKAIGLMFKLHKDQKDCSGLPYVFHPWHVAESMDDEISTVVALLHDVVEDTDITFDDLRTEGFSDAIISTLQLLTHDDSIPYMEYVANLKHDPIARKVKLADLRHNSDLSRLDEITEKDRERYEKYQQAIALLEAE